MKNRVGFNSRVLSLIKKKENFYGLEIIEEIRIKNLNIKVSYSEVVLLFVDSPETISRMEVYLILRYLFSKKGIKVVFGLLRGLKGDFIRKKIKTEVLGEFSPENFLNFLGGIDSSVYYSNSANFLEVVGVEVRFIENLEISPEEFIVDIMRKIGEND